MDTYDIDGPDVNVGDGVPDFFQSDGLSVVHVALSGIIAKKTVYEDLFLFFCPPFVASVFTSEQECGLDDGGRHDAGADEPHDNAN